MRAREVVYRRVLSKAALLACLLLVACSKKKPTASAKGSAPASAAPRTSQATLDSLAALLPKSLNGAPLEPHTWPGHLPTGSYFDRKTNLTTFIDLVPVRNLALARAHGLGLKPGQVKKTSSVEYKAFDVKGFTVVRTRRLNAVVVFPEATTLLADKLAVKVTVHGTDDVDVAVDQFKHIDLAPIEAFAKKNM